MIKWVFIVINIMLAVLMVAGWAGLIKVNGYAFYARWADINIIMMTITAMIWLNKK